MSESGYRFEYKYRITLGAAALLTRQLGALLPRDEHCDVDGGYDIRSLYFDDWQNSAYYDKIAGEMLRSKYRLRFYNGDPDYLVFECKRRRGMMMQKLAARVSREDAIRLMRGAQPSAQAAAEPLIAAFLALRSGRNMSPRVIVGYRRAAFVHPLSNTRVTLDTDVRTGLYNTESFFGGFSGFPVMDDGEAILEVKFDRCLPLYIAEVLESVPQVYCANSKYAACLAPCELE